MRLFDPADSCPPHSKGNLLSKEDINPGYPGKPVHVRVCMLKPKTPNVDNDTYRGQTPMEFLNA